MLALVFQHFLVVINENEDRIDEFKKERKIDLKEVKRGAFKKVVVEVTDQLEEEEDDEEELLAYLEDLEEREEDEEEVYFERVGLESNH